MTREIKFRFWNKDEKKFEYDCLDSRSTYQNPFTRGDLVPLQFTGLKDKNGKEIYDGDIVLRNNKVETANPQWSDRKYIVIWNEEKAQFCLRGEETWGMIWKLEVIGNIYENPELQS